MLEELRYIITGDFKQFRNVLLGSIDAHRSLAKLMGKAKDNNTKPSGRITHITETSQLSIVTVNMIKHASVLLLVKMPSQKIQVYSDALVKC